MAGAFESGDKARLRGRRWMRIRQAVLDTQGPLCPECERQGLVRTWDEVDHINGNRSDNDRANLQGLCLDHHRQKTADQMGHTSRAILKDAGGLPADPNHPWNR